MGRGCSTRSQECRSRLPRTVAAKTPPGRGIMRPDASLRTPETSAAHSRSVYRLNNDHRHRNERKHESDTTSTRTYREAQTRTRTKIRLRPRIAESPKASSILMSWQVVVVGSAVAGVLSFLRDRLGAEKSRHSSAALGTRHKRSRG
ncbi:hypothetical protein BD311DRAFT_752949 [Dichomitus squalens]|uniref:Uncharacterized protein n=1 Tax=Dichomitus squalens TaxID=114155 RepID=A0A4Q9MTN0_9APHY|nr:hypothetical protein BD311DRAFT_752949 [Dichomitus squalens]